MLENKIEKYSLKPFFFLICILTSESKHIKPNLSKVVVKKNKKNNVFSTHFISALFFSVEKYNCWKLLNKNYWNYENQNFPKILDFIVLTISQKQFSLF